MFARSGARRLEKQRLEEVPSAVNTEATAPVPVASSATVSGLSASAKPVTRCQTNYWLIGQSSSSITGAKLPDCRQVMKLFLYLRHLPDNLRSKSSNDEIAYSVADSVIVFWNMARIKTKMRQNCMLDVKKLWKDWNSLTKNKNRKTDPGGKRAAYSLTSSKLFDIGAPDAIDSINDSRLLSQQNKHDDVQFYLDQQTERKAYMYGHGKVFEEKLHKQAVRYKQQEGRARKEGNRVAAEVAQKDIEESEEDYEESTEVYSDEDFMPGISSAQYCPENDYISVKLPKKIMQCEEITSAADRLKLTDSQLTMIVSAVLKAGKCDLSNFDISRSTSRRSRMAKRQKIAESVIDSVMQDPPTSACLHCDGKLITDSLGIPSERLAVLVSGWPQCTEGKLLGVPTIADSTGQSQSNASYDLLEVWNLVPNIVALVFDTTASNSGVKKGAAKIREERINRKPLILHSSRLCCKLLNIIVSSIRTS